MTTRKQDPFRARADTPKIWRPEPFVQIKPEVPTGTTNELITWVDGDVERATVALAVELSNDKPRVGLVKHLEEIIGAK